jgi:thioredoxin 1
LKISSTQTSLFWLIFLPLGVSCKTMAPILEDLKKRLGEDIKIIKIDVDKAQSLAQELRISGVPTLILYKNGQQVWRQSGVVPVHQLEYTVKQFA